MKNFFKYVTASCLGTILALGVIFLIFTLFAISSAPNESVASDSTLHIKLDHIITELSDNISNSNFDFSPVDAVGLNDITKAIRAAADDRKINGILIETEFPQIGQASALSIYQAIEDFKESGKPVFSYGEYFSQTGYMFASLADTTVLNPNGMMDIRGFGMLIPYFGDFVKKFGAKVDVYFAGQYKSAIEPYYRNQSSAQNDYQAEEFLSDWQEQWIENATRYRKVTAEQLTSIIEDGTIVTAEVAEEIGLADRLMYWEDFEAGIEEKLDDDPKYIELADYISLSTFTSGSSSNKVAIVYMEGTILNNNDQKGVISMGTYEKVFDRLMKKKDVEAVVLRVNSGGGDALESDIIWDRVEQLKEAGKYVVASFGDYAASGGYYISCGADKIVTQPNTLTGSIGVFSMIPDFSGALSSNLGIKFDSIGTGENTFMYSPMIPRNAEQNRKLQLSAETTYDKFLTRVAEGRGATKEEIHEVAQGRVWSGVDAVDVGLADIVGDLDDAIAIAAEGAGYEEYKTLQYPVIKKTFYEELLEGVMAAENMQMIMNIKKPNALQKEIMEWSELVSESNMATPQCRMPFVIIEN